MKLKPPRLNQPSRKEQPELILRTQSSMARRKRSPPTNSLAQPSQKERPEKPLPERKLDADKETLPADEQPQKKTADQTDDLLFPTEAELRAIEAAEKVDPDQRSGRRGRGGFEYRRCLSLSAREQYRKRRGSGELG